VALDTPTSQSTSDSYSWETEKAPRVSTARMVMVLAVFGFWLGIMAWMTVRRWYGSLL